MSSAPPVPVTVLTGFLGSGKTTLLNRILTENHGKKIAVIENEFGEIGIDNELVINAEEEVFEMNNGCICCTVRGDLIRILGNLMRRRDKFDYILIETTGLADPAPVAQTFFVDDDTKESLRLDSIVTLVDAKHIALHLDDSPEAQEQVAFADVILLNKTDLVTEEELLKVEARMRSMNAMAKIHRTSHAELPMEHILDVGGFDLNRALSVKPTFLEPEYPFEWGGVFRLEAGTYALALQDGPDPSMSLVVLPVAESSREGLKAVEDRAAFTFSHDEQPRGHGELLEAPGRHYRLRLHDKGEKRFRIKIAEGGLYGLFSEHLPSEFSLRLLGPDGRELEPALAHDYAPAHEHDETVTSVGISFSGDVDKDRLNKWLGKLLMEKGPDIFRMKGILAIKAEDRRFVFQGVHMLFDGRPDRPWGDQARLNQIVFIGRKLDREELNAGVKACLA